MTASGPDPEILASFLDEAGQCVAILNGKLLEAEQGDSSEELVGEMFRAAHSMKGSAGFLELNAIAKVTHSLETILDDVRKGKLTFSQPVVDALFQSFDTVSALLAEAAAGNHDSVAIEDTIHALEATLDAPPPAKAGDPQDELGPLPPWLDGQLDIDDILEAMIARNAGKQIYAIRINMGETFAAGQDPVRLHHGLEDAVTVQRRLPLASESVSPWEPIAEFKFELGLLVFSDGPLPEVLQGTAVPPGEAWALDGSGAPPVRFGATDGIGPGVPAEHLTVREDMTKHIPLWISETTEELDKLDTALVQYEQQPTDRNALNTLFRMMHRLKGSCASMGLDEMSRVAHNCESLLSPFRSSSSTPGESIFQALFQSKDFLRECVDRVQSGESTPPRNDALETTLTSVLSEAPPEASPSLGGWPLTEPQKQDALSALDQKKVVWKVHLALYPETPLADLRYCMILRELGRSCEVLACQPTVDALEAGMESPPPLQILLSGPTHEAALRTALQFDMVERYAIEEVEATSLSAAASQKGASAPPPPQEVRPAANAPKRPLSTQADTVRVDTARLDHLMNVSGELVITKARVTQLADGIHHALATFDFRGIETLLWQARESGSLQHGESGLSDDRLRRIEQMLGNLAKAQTASSALREASLELHRLTNTMQNNVMQARMVPIGPLFQRFHRLVRDVCKERGRSAALVTAGEGTELDKKLIDELTDPLTHLIRNGVDHGLETPEDRVAVGKPESGTIRLEAFHEGGQICIRVGDDGRGLNLDAIKAKAVKNGLMTADAIERLPEQEIFSLIFQPGFSTAAQVTNISGRGVGMDIVKSKITELKGVIEIDSTLGAGSSFTIRLPLTLAMIDALLVRIGSTRYAFPLESVREIVEIEADTIRTVEGRGRVIFLREEAIALVDLAAVMDVDALSETKGPLRAVITKGLGETLAIMVDHVLGDEEVVVKALSEEFSSVRGVSGATVLGDGGIALILDVNGIRELSH